MKLHKIRCRSKKYLTAEIAEYAEIIYFFFLGVLPPGRRPHALWAGGCELRGEPLCFFFD